MSDLLLMEPVALGRALIDRPFDALIQELRELPWPEAGKPVNGPASAFQVVSGALRVTDPSHSSTEERAGTLNSVKNGKWYGCVQTEHYGPRLEARKVWHQQRIEQILKIKAENEGYEHQRILLASYLTEAVNMYKAVALESGPANFIHIQHVAHKQPLTDRLDGFIKEPFDVDVVCGMAGFFDLDWFMSKHPTPEPGPFSLAWFEGVDAGQAYKVEPVWIQFYEQISTMVPDDTLFGTCEHAAAAYGTNGGFACYTQRDDSGELIAARIIFNGKD